LQVLYRIPERRRLISTPAEAKPPPEIRPFIEAMQRVIPNYNDLFSPDAIERYFREVYWQKGEKRLDQITFRGGDGPSEKMSVLESFLVGRDVLDFPYRTVGESFRLIESGMHPVRAPNTLNRRMQPRHRRDQCHTS
jgi:CRISPR-associated endonuclease/helicase Cas3